MVACSSKLGVLTLSLIALASLAACQKPDASAKRYTDATNADVRTGKDWPGYGRTYGEQHYSPLSEVNGETVGKLGLAWSMDLEPGLNPVTQPLEVDGVLYFANGYSVVHAVDAVTGKLLWKYDPEAPAAAGGNLRIVWGSRGIAWWNGKIYTGTADGRLIALDAKSGKQVWVQRTFPQDAYAFISGAPRVFNGKVIIGFGGTIGPVRSYVTTYDAETGKQLWRFYTTPGDPAKGFEDKTQEMAAKTWAGHWWKYGGGGQVWNAMAYDPETDTVFIGTGSGYPWNRRARSDDKGDNLFLASIVALDAKSGAYKWHYQVTPGDTWDFDATMDIQLADLKINGKLRKVLIQAPKNGFFYVIDRLTGKLISAEKYAPASWASRIDVSTGRPVETPGARYPNGSSFDLTPTGAGAHSWTAMAFSPRTQLAYIPVQASEATYSDQGIDTKNWVPPTDRTLDGSLTSRSKSATAGSASLVAWDPVAQRAAWTIPFPTHVNGGLMATGGDLVFQGTIDGTFNAYDAKTGKRVWSFQSGAPIMAAPISYSVHGQQYVTVLTGLGTGLTQALGITGVADKYQLDSRTMPRRVLTFRIGGTAALPANTAKPDPIVTTGYEFKPDQTQIMQGFGVYMAHCHACHGLGPSSTQAPDLRRSQVPPSAAAFAGVVRGGDLVAGGMPKFGELTDDQLLQLRQVIRATAVAGKDGKPVTSILEQARHHAQTQ